MSVSNVDMRDAFFDRIFELANTDKNLIFLTADHAALSLNRFREKLPKQYINLGISEQNMISVAAGLALSGKNVFVYSIVNFVTLRCLEQISVDLSGMRLSVNIVGVGTGFTYSTDGPTHHGIQDVAAMASIPNLDIYNSSDPVNTKAFAEMAYREAGPKYIRIEKGNLPQLYSENHLFSDGAFQLKEGRDITIIATGNMVQRALEIAEKLEKQSLHVGVIDLYRLKPINGELLVTQLSTSSRVVTLEEHIMTGGMGSMVSAVLCDHGLALPLKRVAIQDQHCFQYSNDRQWMHNYYGLSVDKVMNVILQWMS